MSIDFLLNIFHEHKNQEAIVWKDMAYHYSFLLDRISCWKNFIKDKKIPSGSVIILEGDYSPNSIALLLVLIDLNHIVVPIANATTEKKQEIIKIAQGEYSFIVNDTDEVKFIELQNTAAHSIYDELHRLNHPGLVLFTSGTTGERKAVAHDFSRLLEKFKVRRHNLRTLCFFLFDHIGGLDTLFYSLSNGSCIVSTDSRNPGQICSLIEKFRIEVLPVSPTFLNLLILSESYANHDLSSLKYITYGTEVMPEVTLKRCVELFPGIIILQKYGSTEFGSMHSKSKTSDSVWVKIGGEGFKTRIVNGILHIKASSAMMGYLNVPNHFTEDGWFVTGDAVEEDGEYIRFLGRQSDLINVGGQKVYPAEVENVIQGLPQVAEVIVYGEKNPITGNIVCAQICLTQKLDEKSFISELKQFCKNRLESYKIPIKVKISDQIQHTKRLKKKRLPTDS